MLAIGVDGFVGFVGLSGVVSFSVETHPRIRFCPICCFRMHSRGIKTRTINHPVLQDSYKLVLKLKQRRWCCTNPHCLYTTNESFNFVDKRKRNTNAADMLIINAFRDLSASASSIAEKFHVSDTYVLDTFDRYVKMDRLELTDIISIIYHNELRMDSFLRCMMNTYDYEDSLFRIDPDLRELRDLKEMYIRFNAQNAGKPMDARIGLDRLIDRYLHCGNPIFHDFADLLIRYHDYIINSFIMVEKHGQGKIYSSRLSNGPIESLNRKAKDLKRLGRGYRNFEHFRTRFLFATRDNPVINASSSYNPVTYYDTDE